MMIVVKRTVKLRFRNAFLRTKLSRVRRSNGSIETITIADLKVGDHVRVSGNKFSEIWMFGHIDKGIQSKFVKVETEHGHIKASGGHYVYVDGQLKAMRLVRPGNMLQLHNGTLTSAKKITVVNATGLYNPHTHSGDIVVNGYRASCYTEAIHPTIAHAVLKPFAILYTAGLKKAGRLAEYIIKFCSDYAIEIIWNIHVNISRNQVLSVDHMEQKYYMYTYAMYFEVCL